MERKAEILIVHSQRILIDLLRDHLARDSYALAGASSGDEARKLLESQRPGLVVISGNAPGGMDLIRHLRSIENPGPMIGLADSAESRKDMEALGVEHVLGSDANLEVLLNAIRPLLTTAGATASGNAGHLLVVDDEKDLLHVAQKYLTGRGYVVETATNGTEAMQILRRDPEIKLVLLDIRIPDIGGLEVLRQIKARTPNPEVIMMTGVQDADIARLAFKLGAFDYFIKPFEWDRLDGLITACLAHIDNQQNSSRSKS